MTVIETLRGLVGKISDEALWDAIKFLAGEASKQIAGAVKPGDIKMIWAGIGGHLPIQDEQIWEAAETVLTNGNTNIPGLEKGNPAAVAKINQLLSALTPGEANTYRLIVTGVPNPAANDTTNEIARLAVEAAIIIQRHAALNDAEWANKIRNMNLRQLEAGKIIEAIKNAPDKIIATIQKFSDQLETDTRMEKTARAVNKSLKDKLRQQWS